MDWTRAVLRRDLIEWSDRHRLATAAAVNAAGVDVLSGFQRTIDGVQWNEALWNSERLAAEEMDRAMQEALTPRLDRLFDTATRALRRIDARLQLLSVVVPDRVWPAVPASPSPLPAEEAPSVLAAPKGTPLPPDKVALTLLDTAGRDVQAGLQLGERQFVRASGLRGRLMRAARGRLRTRWIGWIGVPPPVLALLDATFVAVVDEAWEKTR